MTLAHLLPQSASRLRRPYFYWPLLTISAMLTPFAFAPYYAFWLMPILFAIFIRLIMLRPNMAVRSAYIFGLISYTCQFYWIHTALHDVSGLPNLYALPLTLLLPAYLALYPAICFWLLEKTRLSLKLTIGLMLPILWTLTEYAREHALTGFGWGALGYSQISPHSPLAGFAPIGGLQLVTLACAFLGAWLALIWQHKRLQLIPLSLAILLLLSGLELRQIHFTQPNGSQASVALAQGNIPQTLKWQPETLAHTIQTYFNQVANSDADIIILPETAIPIMRQDLQQQHPGVLAQFAYEAQRNGSALATGIAQYNQDYTGYLNAVINLSHYRPDEPNNIPYYAKNHLVPFGEYKPLPWLTERLYRLMNMPLADFSRGGNGQAPLLLGNQKIAFNICYEDGFGDELIASAKQSTLLANVSNMAWYGKSNAMYQHLQQSQTRALELGRYMVRATNTGATAIISPQGNIQALAPINTETVLIGNIQGYTGETPYMRLGGSRPLIFALIALALTLQYLLPILSKRHQRQ